MLLLKGVESGYGESMVLRQVHLDIRPGQVVCLMGRNGVGKSTLLRTLMGILKVRSGSIHWDGKEVTKWDSAKRARVGIGYVPQGRDVFPQMSVRENLLLGLETAPKGAKVIPIDVLEMFPVLKTMMNRQGGDLSGGQQQQLAFARALAAKPRLLLLDEPTEGIQPSIVDDIRDVIIQIKNQGDTAILLVEQSEEFVRGVADYIYVMDKGAIAMQGKPEELELASFEHYLTV
ncbi:urea ABC transporter ATP-binding subunit UrtE [Paenibacillus sp. An7]|uniref:urea ABC transporter ATP-binding subunit UrtE n=1 Tax=Paenibacillus sp. An7 TaxID=2689577 RepID=UPI00135868A3|nr:urea ABC transporter ATP-binding subunit UrtE [Paenibacillus sp. An7]